MKRTNHCILILALLTCFACKKKEYPVSNVKQEKVFYVNLLMDGEPLNIDAGKDNYYMSSTIVRDASNVYGLTGEFKQQGCTTCPNSIKIQINDSVSTPPGNTINFNSIVQVKKYGFKLGSIDKGFSKIILEFTNAEGKTFTSYNESQPLGSSFEVLSVTNYTSDVSGKQIKKVTLKFNCVLYHQTQSITLQGTEVTLGFPFE